VTEPEKAEGGQQPSGESTAPEGGKAPEPTEQEKNYWTRLESLLDGRIDAAVKRHLGKSPLGTKRTDGRKTVPEMFAEFMFGKPDDK